MKFTTAALVGAAYAHECPVKAWFHHQKEMRFHHFTKEECPNIDESQSLDHHTFMQDIHRTMVNSLYKGIFHDARSEMVTDKCFGSWMSEKVDKLHEYGHKLHAQGIWGLTHDEIKDGSNIIWDLALDNIDDCEIYRFIYTKYSWCMDNIEMCVYHTGLANRLLDNGFLIATQAWSAWHNFNHQDKCETDVQMIGRVGRVVEEVAGIYSTVKGIDSHWSLSAPVEKLSLRQMWHNIMEKKSQTPRPHEECPFKTLFKSLFGSDVMEGMIEMVG